MKYVIGTAGHVDHGKSTLVAALTGIHPDRLKEEQAREMTIELGFAWFDLPDGSPVGIVDVPGHRDFVENMLAGVGGIDAAIFVIAADEGVMPQTREHLAILDILQIHGGIIALTKCDMIDEPTWLDLVEEDIRKVTSNTILNDAPIIRVSARTGQGLQDLITALHTLLKTTPTRSNTRQPRLSVDRVFTMTGFGTVVTGTLTDGDLKVGDEIEVLPTRLRGRIRGLQTHKTKEDSVHPGQRTAVNISGIDVDSIQRGNSITLPGQYEPTRRIDAEFKFLDGDYLPLKHHHEVKFFLGALETRGFLRLLMNEELTPGNTSYIQIDLVEPIIARKGDRFILRRPSPAETLGGGVILDPHPSRRYRRFDEGVQQNLRTKKEGSPQERLQQVVELSSPVTRIDLLRKSHLTEVEFQQYLQELITSGDIVQVTAGKSGDQEFFISRKWQQKTIAELTNLLERYHLDNPLRLGIPREEIKNRLGIDSKLFPVLLADWLSAQIVKEEDNFISLQTFQIKFNPAQKSRVDALLAQFAANPYSPPSVKECIESVGTPSYEALIILKTLQQISDEVVYRTGDIKLMRDKTVAIITANQRITLADFRDQFSTSRKYAQAFLEYLDQINVTLRQGDFRVLHPKAQH